MVVNELVTSSCWQKKDSGHIPPSRNSWTNRDKKHGHQSWGKLGLQAQTMWSGRKKR